MKSLFLCRCYSIKCSREILPYSSLKIFNKEKRLEKNGAKTLQQIELNNDNCSSPNSEYRENQLKIQMISKNLYLQLFGSLEKLSIDNEVVLRCKRDLERHGINIEENHGMEDVELKIPKLYNDDIEKHFQILGEKLISPYELSISQLICNDLPKAPDKWIFQAGWTQYDPVTGTHNHVKYPEVNALVFDVEVCMSAGHAPTIATAIGGNCWYSWTSPNLTDSGKNPTSRENHDHYTLDDLIPLGSNQPKLILGHNVSYDRARIREQYLIEDTGARFLDTMSLHVCVSGITSYQRTMLKSKKDISSEDQEWLSQSSLNSLAEVYKLYCDGEELQKEVRATFVKGNLNDIRDDFQNLMSYCSKDVIATAKVFKKLFPIFKQRFPHPVSLAGMLELGSAYLPVNKNWKRYINECNLTYEEANIEAKYHLCKRANEACSMLINDDFKKDLWMWDEDWIVQNLKLKKHKTAPKTKQTSASKEQVTEDKVEPAELNTLRNKFDYLYNTKSLLPARRPCLPGYPAWYRKLCMKSPFGKTKKGDWKPGPILIGTGMQIAPKLLSLCWEGYPLHYSKENGWGFLIPLRRCQNIEIEGIGKVPIEQLAQRCPVLEESMTLSEAETDDGLNMLWKDVESSLTKKNYFKKVKNKKSPDWYKGTGVWCGTILEGCCLFLKLPHKNGTSFRVGNPLARDFLNKFSESVLTSGDASAERIIKISRMMSYWRNNRDRIMGQMVVWISPDFLPEHVRKEDYREYGAICPQVVVCGTLTRRAMEPTWMTASNVQKERIGSELRAMVQAPSGYKIVGADVDSQELWIASALGDAHAARLHGATALGWMTLSGSKSNGTDMHSVTAKAVGISRDHAKVINYARIYGAGQNFAERLLKQFNPSISDSEAKSKAMKMFALTKGKKIYRLRKEFIGIYPNKNYSGYEAFKIASLENRPVPDMFHKGLWQGGSESSMFNMLENISSHKKPTTPFLECRLSRALEPLEDAEDRFLPTRVNWVVQSGAVDFLHLMLVTMRWLMGNHVRFCLSFHDELRYLVRDELAYKAALAMHVTNLMTRSFFAKRIGIPDLPMSVAFFSAVEVDSVLRKDSSMDCKTPSNPHGLRKAYGIQEGESLNIYECISKAEGSDLTKWPWHEPQGTASK